MICVAIGGRAIALSTFLHDWREELDHLFNCCFEMLIKIFGTNWLGWTKQTNKQTKQSPIVMGKPKKRIHNQKKNLM